MAAVAHAHRMPPEVLEPAFAGLAAVGYASFADGDASGVLRLTPAGQAEIDRPAAAWRQWLDGRLADWSCADPVDRARLGRAIDQIARRLLEEAEQAEPAV